MSLLGLPPIAPARRNLLKLARCCMLGTTNPLELRSAQTADPESAVHGPRMIGKLGPSSQPASHWENHVGDMPVTVARLLLDLLLARSAKRSESCNPLYLGCIWTGIANAALTCIMHGHSSWAVQPQYALTQ